MIKVIQQAEHVYHVIRIVQQGDVMGTAENVMSAKKISPLNKATIKNVQHVVLNAKMENVKNEQAIVMNVKKITIRIPVISMNVYYVIRIVHRCIVMERQANVNCAKQIITSIQKTTKNV